MGTEKRSIRLDDDVYKALGALPGKSINDGLRQLLLSRDGGVTEAVLEILELVRGLPDLEDIVRALQAQPLPRGTQSREDLQAMIDDKQGHESNVHNPPPPGRRISFAEQREIDRRKHLESVAEGDGAARAADRSDIVYDAQT